MCISVYPCNPQIIHPITEAEYNLVALHKDLISVTLLAPLYRRYYRVVRLAVYKWL
jgi:hypothetical protein